MAEFPLPVLQIWRSRKRVAIQIQLMNIHVSECKYYCLHLVPKFGDMCDRQNWRLHPTAETAPKLLIFITETAPPEMASTETAPTIMASLNDGHAETASPKRPQLSWCWLKRLQLKWLKKHTETATLIYHTNVTLVTSTNIALKTNRNSPIYKSILRILCWIQTSYLYG